MVWLDTLVPKQLSWDWNSSCGYCVILGAGEKPRFGLHWHDAEAVLFIIENNSYDDKPSSPSLSVSPFLSLSLSLIWLPVAYCGVI